MSKGVRSTNRDMQSMIPRKGVRVQVGVKSPRLQGLSRRDRAFLRRRGGWRQINTKLFEQYIETYKSLVYSICLMYVKNPFDAEDLAQDTFVSAYKSFSGFTDTNPKSWFARIASNKCRDFLKSSARSVIPVDIVDLGAVTDAALSVEQHVENKESDNSVYHLCRRLKEPYRSVAIAYYCHDETITEIGERTGENRKTVATRLYRARDLIKTFLKEDVYENDG